MPDLIEYTHEEWRNEGIRRFGPDPRYWKFVCPGCGHVQSGDDFIAAGIKDSSNKVYQECIGRYTGGKSWAKMGKNERGPCDYAAFGLLCIAPVRVTLSDGSTVASFAFAEVA